VSFAEVETIFVDVGCTRGSLPGRPPGLGGCHSSSNPAGALDLTQAAFDNLVGVSSAFYPDSGEILVVPGDPDNSLLLKKLTNDLPDDGSLGEPMPLGEAIQWRELPQDQIDTIRNWIADGANP
jgi:hypothetical protein